MTTRRSFLQQSALVAAGVMLKPSSLFAASSPKIKKVGLQLFTLREELNKDVKDTIARVAKIGYQQIETYYGYAGPNKTSEFWGLNPKEFRSLLDVHNLTSPSGHYQLGEFLTPGGSDESVKRQIEVAHTVGHTYFTIPVTNADREKREHASLDDYKFFAERFNKAGEMVKAAGMKMAYHNHSFEFNKTGDVCGYDILLKETDPKLVHFELDIFWAVLSGNDPVQLFEKHPGRFAMWHVKDRDKNDPKTFTEVGAGTIDFKAIFAKAKTAGLEFAFIEQDKIVIDKYNSLKQSFDYVKKNFMA